MGEWKLILGHEVKELKGFQGSEPRMAECYQIATRDEYGFLLHEYEKVNYEDLYDKKNKDGTTEKVMSNVLIINDEYYRMRGSKEDGKFVTDFNRLVDVFIEVYKLPYPSYDITDVKLAIKYFKELIELKNELLMLK